MEVVSQRISLFFLFVSFVWCSLSKAELAGSHIRKSSSPKGIFLSNKTNSNLKSYQPDFEACQKIDAKGNLIPITTISPSTAGIPTLVEKDQNDRKLYDLIDAIYKQTYARLQENLAESKKRLQCLDSIYSSLDNQKKILSDICSTTLTELANTSVAYGRTRLELAIALPDDQVLNETQYKTLNTKLRTPVNTFKKKQMEPLSKDEKNYLEKDWNKYLSDLDQEAKEKTKNHYNPVMGPESEQFKKIMIQNVRQKAMYNYHLQMTKYPLLQFLSSNKGLSEKDYRKAYTDLILSTENEIQKIKDRQNFLKLNPDKISSDDLAMLNYQTAEEVLQENPDYCGIAQSFMEYQKAKNIYLTTASLTFFIGGGLLKIPPSALVTVGAALTGYSTYNSYVEYKKAMQAYLTSPTYELEIFQKSKVDAQKADLLINGVFLSTMPFGYLTRKALMSTETTKAISFQQILSYFRTGN